MPGASLIFLMSVLSGLWMTKQAALSLLRTSPSSVEVRPQRLGPHFPATLRPAPHSHTQSGEDMLVLAGGARRHRECANIIGMGVVKVENGKNRPE